MLHRSLFINRNLAAANRRVASSSSSSVIIAASVRFNSSGGNAASTTNSADATSTAAAASSGAGEASSSSSSSYPSSSASTESPSSPSSSASSSWKDMFASLPIFRKHKMNRNGNDFESLPEPRIIPKFKFRGRFFYNQAFRSKKLDYFYKVENGQLLSMATVYKHNTNPDITVTFVPLSHSGHPQFYYQVDLLLCQHDSVLMEGRVPFKQAPFSTLVPPRPLPNQIRPVDLAESMQSWEPKDPSAYWQPFSWGVRDSPNYTVIHAADCYDYEKLPMLASLRFNMPLLGSFNREIHCLSMIPFLVDNGYKKFAIPWGAAHMPIMHEMLVQNNFSVVSVSALPIFDEADGDISLNHVRSNQKMIAKKETREDLWLAGMFVAFTATFLYYNSYVEINGQQIGNVRGKANEAEMRAFEEEYGLSRGAKHGADMFERKPMQVESIMRKNASELHAKLT